MKTIICLLLLPLVLTACTTKEEKQISFSADGVAYQVTDSFLSFTWNAAGDSKTNILTIELDNAPTNVQPLQGSYITYIKPKTGETAISYTYKANWYLGSTYYMNFDAPGAGSNIYWHVGNEQIRILV